MVSEVRRAGSVVAGKGFAKGKRSADCCQTVSTELVSSADWLKFGGCENK